MLPVPTRTAVAAFLGCVCAVVIGVGASRTPAVVVGMAGLVTLGAAFTMAYPLGRRLRRQRLEFAWWLEQGPGGAAGAVVPGIPFDVRCYVRHRGPQTLQAPDIRPIVPVGARWIDDALRAVQLGPKSRTEFAFRLEAPAVGRVVLQGLAITVRGPLGLFDVPLYFPNPLVIRVLPRAARRARQRARPVGGLPVERTARTSLRRRGGGTELYELRELLPGDPYNSIAWKASARFGKLMVKEVEHEVQERRWILLDVSGTMRGGPPGHRKLDFAIEAAAAEARRALHEGDRVGVMTVDGRVLDQVQPADEARQLPRIYEALLAATEVVDADLTDADDAEVVSIVGRYVRHQDGVDYARDDGWDIGGLLRHVTHAMRGQKVSKEVHAGDPALAPLRRFCLLRGVPLPYRADPREGSKGPGLAEALRAAGGSPAHIAVITDLDGVGSPEPLRSTVRLLRAHGHRIVFVLPDAPSFAPEPRTPLEADLYRIYGRAEERRIREAQQLLRGIGVPVLKVRGGDHPEAALARAGAQRRAA